MSKYGMVIDLTRCTGCQTCVVACQLHNNQRPGMAWIKVDAIERGTWPDQDRFALPHACMHCDNAPCVNVCPSGASTQRADGIVTVDYDTCIACGACLMVCPYDARSISFRDDWHFGAAEAAPYEAFGAPHADVAEKCVFCAERVDAGLSPHCVEACLTGARIFGDLDDPASAVSTYIKEQGAEAVRGTSVYYVKGHHDVDVREALMTNVSEVPAVMLEEKPSQPQGEKQEPNFAAIGAGGVVVAAVAAGIGFAAGTSHGKKKAAAGIGGKDGE